VRGGWLGLAAIVVALGTGAATDIRTAPAQSPAPSAYVEVQFDTGVTVQSLTADGSMPTLEQQGFRQVPVPEGMTAADFAAELRKRPDVLAAEPDQKVTAAAIPNDPAYNSSGSNQAQYLTQIGAPAAWDLSTGSPAIPIAIIDSGTDLSHPDLAGRLWENPIDNRSDGIDRDNNGCVNDRYGCRFVTLFAKNAADCGYTTTLPIPNVMDDTGTSSTDVGSHGTLVAGIVAAAGNNAQGVTGVAWNARVMTVKVLDCNAEGTMSDVARGIEYAVRSGARIINVSVASVEVSVPTESLRTAMQMAQNAGVIVVAAAGNYGTTAQPGTRYPAAFTEFPNLIAVGAANNLNDNNWASYSSYGPAIDFAAPGNRILSTARTDILPLYPYAVVGDPSSGFSGGTSYAAPFVSGMFALMMARNSRLSAGELIQIARDTATAAPEAPHGQNWAGSGILNIGAAVARVPMSIDGTPLHDWQDVPAGTSVEAIIDGVSCGNATTDAFGLVGRFSIRVKTTAEIPNCGQPGEIVQLFIGGAPAVPTFPWGPPNTDMGLRDREVSSVSPPPGSLVVQALNGSWANIGHLEPSGQLPGAVSGLPTPWTSIFKWDPVKETLSNPGAYLRFFRGAPSYASDYQAIAQYDAYWVDAPATNMASPNPNPPPGRSIQLKAGWNNFMYTGQSRSVSDALASIAGKYEQILQYDNATGEWHSHVPGQQRFLNDFGGLFTLKVYWVLLSDDATLVMD
jgi:subtilisin family serine protease